ncbi:hypothetical protein K438DRAFT_1980277 [Mycena galopus ATCC 62051]|nr:hypothetical protein K438DRAFT_1980277 [Mycena galopus ATCC 62051]
MDEEELVLGTSGRAPAQFVIERDAGVPSDEVDRPHHRDRLESLVALLLLSFPLVRPLPLPPWSPHRSLRPTYRNLGVVDARPQAEREFALMGLLLCIRGNHVPPGASLSTKTTSRSSSKTCTAGGPPSRHTRAR